MTADLAIRRAAAIRRVGSVILIVLGLITASSSHAATPDEQRDARLATRVSVESKGLPVDQLVRELSKSTGVKLSCDTKVGDERLVAFIPSGSLAQVMRGVANLYRCAWIADEEVGTLTYRLRKPTKAGEEETELRRIFLRRILERLESSLRNPPKGDSPESDWSAAYPDLLPLLQTHSNQLVNNGEIAIPVSSLAQPLRERVVSSLQPVLDLHRALAEKSEGVLNAARGGPRIRSAETLGPPPDARQSVVVAEIVLAEAPQIWVGLRSNTGTLHVWFRASDENAANAGVTLYRDHPLEPQNDRRAPGDMLNQPVTMEPDRNARAGDWIARLQELSRASGVAILSDCYPNFRRGFDAHPRGSAPFSRTGSVRSILDGFCGGVGEKHSFWWRNDEAALIRSSRWLWDAEGVLPSELSELVGTALRKRKPLSADHLRELAGLNRFQVQTAGPLVPSYEAWTYAVRFPARMEPRAGNLLFQPAGLKWEYLSPAARSALLPSLPIAPDARPIYHAAIVTRVTDLPSQGGVFAHLEISARWGFNQLNMALLVPLRLTVDSDRMKALDPMVRILRP